MLSFEVPKEKVNSHNFACTFDQTKSMGLLFCPADFCSSVPYHSVHNKSPISANTLSWGSYLKLIQRLCFNINKLAEDLQLDENIAFIRILCVRNLAHQATQYRVEAQKIRRAEVHSKGSTGRHLQTTGNSR